MTRREEGTTKITKDTKKKNVDVVAKTQFKPSQFIPSCSSCPSWSLDIHLC
jgi:hypothetical protein